MIGHALASALRSVKRLGAARHVLVSPEGEEHGVVDAALAERGIVRRLGVVLPHTYAAPHLVANSNNLIATLMKGVMVNRGVSDDLVVAAPPLELPTVDFRMLWHRRRDQHPVAGRNPRRFAFAPKGVSQRHFARRARRARLASGPESDSDQ
jgi:DNA-binding transcriptional LysR family regulator